MRSWIGAIVGLGLTAAALMAVQQQRRGTSNGSNRGERVGDSLEGENPVPAATGREETHDPLGSAHDLPGSQAKYVRAEQRLVNGKNTSGEREKMFHDGGEGSGESGSMGHPSGQEDRNPIGPHKG